MLVNPRAQFPLARQLRSERGATIGDVMRFVSGLYFRGKLTYARAFGRPPDGFDCALVMSPGEGLRFACEPITLARLQSWAEVEVDADNARFTEPLVAHARELHARLQRSCRFVLLGSVATDKYTRPLQSVLGDDLLFPGELVGRGDMSRGAVLLRAVRDRRELDYLPVDQARLVRRPRVRQRA